MLGKLLGNLIPADPREMLLDFIEGEDITLTVGEKLRITLRVTRDPNDPNVMNFKGRVVRGAEKR